jgi:hypothetical protein
MRTKIFSLVMLLSLLLAACGGKTTVTAEAPAKAPAEAPTKSPVETPSVSSTTDPCSAENLPEEVKKVNELMRQFDDSSMLAQNTPQAQLPQVIPSMQKILRDAQDQQVPACLETLKKLQVNHMSVVIQTLLVLLGNSKLSPDAVKKINAGVAQARDLHHQYDVELARLLGLTLVAPPTNAAPTPTVTPAAAVPNNVTNPDTAAVMLVASPDTKAGGVAMLDPGKTALAFGQTADGKWIQVEVPEKPGQKAWVSASLVKVSGQLPVVTP